MACQICCGLGIDDPVTAEAGVGCISCGKMGPLPVNWSGTWPRPVNDWVLVRLDPLPEKAGSILLPSKGSIYTATVLSVGPGAEVVLDHQHPDKKRFVPTEVRRGEKIVFLRWAIEGQQGQAVRSSFEELGADLALIKERDILFVLELSPDEKVELSL